MESEQRQSPQTQPEERELRHTSSRDAGNSPAPGKRAGLGMLIICFALGIGALTLYFDSLLDRQANPNRIPLSRETAEGVREVVLEQGRQGHYYADGTVNGVEVTFLLDTGATDVAIPSGIARAAGLRAGMALPFRTANGVVTAYATQIDELVLGNIVLHKVNASISPNMTLGDNVILLGMSALRQVEFYQRGTTLTLRQFPG